VDQPDPASPEDAGEAHDGESEARRSKGAQSAGQRVQTRGFEARAVGSLGADATHVEPPPGTVQPAHDLDELSLGAAEDQGIPQEENRRPPLAAGPVALRRALVISHRRVGSGIGNIFASAAS
jgi:hypothetical protein